MSFPNPQILKVVLDAYIAIQQPRWDSFILEPLARIAKLITFRTYEGEEAKKHICTNLKTNFLQSLEADKLQTLKWAELCCYLNKTARASESTISTYLDFMRHFIFIHLAKDTCFKEDLVKHIIAIKSESKPVESKEISSAAKPEEAYKATLTELERLLQDFSQVDAVKLTVELQTFFAVAIQRYTKEPVYSNYAAFETAALSELKITIDSPAEIKAEIKPTPDAAPVEKKEATEVKAAAPAVATDNIIAEALQPVSALKRKMVRFPANVVDPTPYAPKETEEKREAPEVKEIHASYSSTASLRRRFPALPTTYVDVVKMTAKKRPAEDTLDPVVLTSAEKKAIDRKKEFEAATKAALLLNEKINRELSAVREESLSRLRPRRSGRA